MSPEASQSENEFEATLTTGQLFLELIKVILLALVIIIPVRVFLFQPFFVSGQSMEPSFDEGQYLV
ncbi:MAG: S26 family signal peptidase, partial [Candidatus Moranbacteria bacterium]|nr:S26 family signal peptidase [Candidatus Moranbacteria bacterium]